MQTKPVIAFLNRNSGIDCGIIKILIRIFEVSFSKLIDMLYKLDSEEGVNMLKKAYAKLTVPQLKERQNGEPDATERNPYHRDFTRILYSASFRRLQGKMQILGIQNDAFFRNRLTHSLEVSQIARDIASKIGKIIGDNAYSADKDLYVIEAAALAHDIGHPAFGHSGERALDAICKDRKIGRFEGNAQNFKIINDIEKKFPTTTGLNLTYRLLLAINKYIVKENTKVEKFLYKKDYEDLEEKRKQTDLIGERTLDVQIIDVADEIAYAVHDLEDGLSMGYFTIDEIIYLLKKKFNKEDEPTETIVEDSNKVDAKEVAKFLGIVKSAKDVAYQASSYKTTQEYSQIFRRTLVSKLTYEFINDIGWVEIDEEAKKEHGITTVAYELGCCQWHNLVHALKKLTYKAVTRHDDIQLYEKRGSIVINGLFRIYSNKDNIQLLTPDYRPDIDFKKKTLTTKEQKKLDRAAIDFIAGMMDDYAKAMYKRYYNVEFDDIPIDN